MEQNRAVEERDRERAMRVWIIMAGGDETMVFLLKSGQVVQIYIEIVGEKKVGFFCDNL